MDDGDHSLRVTDLLEWARILGVLAFWGVVLIILSLLPPVVSHHAHPLAGLACAVLAFPAWSHLGPRPMPGLVDGTICLGGFAGLLANLVIVVGATIRALS